MKIRAGGGEGTRRLARGAMGLIDLGSAVSRSAARSGWKREFTQRLAHVIDEQTPLLSPYPWERSRAVASLREFWQVISPVELDGLDYVRIGPPNDGGYVIPDVLDALTGAICVGVGKNDGFDLDLARMGLKVVQVDHSIATAPSEHPNLEFVRSKLVAKVRTSGECTLSQLAAKFDCDARLLLKVDIEGDEWVGLLHDSSVLNRFDIVVVELHGVNTKAMDTDSEALTKLRELNRTLVPVVVHANNWGGGIVLGSIAYPDVVEVTWVHRERIATLSDLVEHENLLCAPNNPTLPWAPLHYADLG